MNLRDLPDMSDALKQVQAIEEKKKLDPVGKEDGDIDNDGDKDASDSYLLNRRKAVKKAIAKEEVEQVDEADSLAAMAARREKRLQAQRKKMGKTGAGHDFGHDYGMTAAQRKAQQDKEFKAFLGRKEDFDIVGWAEDAILELSEEEAIDSLTDEELVDIFETALLELAEGPEELEEMATILEGFEVLSERVDPKETQRRRDQAKDRLATGAAMKKAAAKSSESKPSRGERLKAAAKAAGSKAKAGLKTAGKAAARGAGYAVGAAQRAGSAAKKEFSAGHKRGKEGSGGGSSSSGESSSSSDSRPAPKSSGGGGGSDSSRGSTRRAVGGALKAVGRLAGKAIKKGVGKTARLVAKGSDKLAKRLGEDYEHIDHLVESGLFSLDEISNVIEERYKGKHGQSSAEYKDDRSQGGKMVSGDSKMSGAEYTHGRRVKAANPGSQPDEGGKTKPKSQGKMDKGTRADLEYRKANLKKEEVEIEEGVRDLDPEKGTAERKAKLEKKRGMKLDDHPQYKKEDRAATREQEIMEGILKRAADKAKSEYGKYKKFGKASGEAVDRLQRMNQHKQDKYGPSTFKQRMKSGAEHNTDNEKKAKEGK
ncbi:hypothetical protein [Synechococcus phage S-MS29]|nr:hypothetical protein [Synechococcus phage S-MS29]